MTQKYISGKFREEKKRFFNIFCCLAFFWGDIYSNFQYFQKKTQNFQFLLKYLPLNADIYKGACCGKKILTKNLLA